LRTSVEKPGWWGTVGSTRTVLLGVALLGCGRTPPFAIDDGGDSGDVVDLDPCESDPSSCVSIVTLQRAADILFVIDNSGSMAEEQGTLAANFPRFIEVLEGELVGASYRVGITTTDQRGLRATSCRSRLEEFEGWFNLGPDLEEFYVEEREAGCLSSCGFDSIDLQPTENGDGDVRARPWIERSAGASNLPPGISVAQALQCIGPQGINGDGYEMPLESMRSVLEENVAGFMRDDALLAVVFVTDETDCSQSFEHNAWLREGGWNVYWSYDDHPSSAACWRAGTTCAGGPGTYDTCWAENKDMDGNATGDPDEAVLYPVQRYIDVLNAIGSAKAARGGNSTVLVASIAGVPVGYEDGVELQFADSPLWEFNMEYGIGPGCGHGTEALANPPGIPPVRLRAFSEAFATDRRNMFSICSDDYAIALVQIAEAIERLGARACVPGCATDINEHVDGLQPGCSVIEERADDQGGDRAVEPCVIDNETWHFAREDQTLCYRQLTDGDGSTPWTHDDMSPQCVTRGSNLEFVVERRDGVPVPPGVGVRVDCPLEGPVGDTCLDL
jgi:hypothetical protein